METARKPDWRARNAESRELMARINRTANAPITVGEIANRNVAAGLCPHGSTFVDECPRCDEEGEQQMHEMEARADREQTQREETAKHEFKREAESQPTVASFARLKREPGEPWGVRVPLPSNDANPGCTVTVRTRAGEEKRIVLGSEVATFDDAALFTISSERKLADSGGKAESIAFRRKMVERLDGRVPAGRYAVDGEDSTTDFYFVDFADSGDWKSCVFVTLHTGGGDQRMSPKASATILGKIVDAGARESSARYGRELGHCGVCGRELTNEASRELGIGPKCAGKMGWS